MKRKANAVWKGTGLEGSGVLTTQSGAFENQPYSFKMRFQDEDGKSGTNPEELIAAAHAGCFAMALSFQVSNAGFTPEELDVDAVVQMDKSDAGWSISGVTLNLTGSVPDMSEEKFMELANAAKEGCPISKVLSAVPITLNATFKS